MNRLKKLRKANGLTLKELAKDLNYKGFFEKINDGTLSRYENGRREPKFKVVVKLADYFDVSVDYLIGKEPMKIEQQIDPPEDEVWGYTLYGEEILVGEAGIRETTRL